MITLYGFGRVDAAVIGVTRDLRAQWALEETGLPYRVRGLDYFAGELKQAEFAAVSHFCLVPVIDDEGFIVNESGAIVLYLAEKAGKLVPGDFKGRTQVSQWCFAVLNTVERPLLEIAIIDMFGKPEDAARRADMVKEAGRWLGALERRLEGRAWISGDDFSVADLLAATVLRIVRKTDLLDPYPRVKTFYDRALARPAWQRTLASYAERLGVRSEEIR
jgi:glutathione S-transferase